MKVNVGGDRIGSGAKMNVELHNYYRSTHNLSKKFQSSLAPGVLYPAYVNVGLNGDKFDIDIKHIIRTLPTRGPLFGAYKVQIDTYVAPIRLYHGILHNNPINIGLNMNQVILPKTMLVSNYTTSTENNTKQINESCLWKYLGMSGLGRVEYQTEEGSNASLIRRKVNALPMLAYYDIFKNYYANKQEENAYYINKDTGKLVASPSRIEFYNSNNQNIGVRHENYITYTLSEGETIKVLLITEKKPETIKLKYGGTYTSINCEVTSGEAGYNVFNYNITHQTGYEGHYVTEIEFYIDSTEYETMSLSLYYNDLGTYSEGVKLNSFSLENIDNMRKRLLQIHEGEEYITNETRQSVDNLPYGLFYHNEKDLQSPMAGLVVKTYQSDLFNNWIKTETISGSNGIAEITRVDTSNGLAMDALNLAQKVYNMLNRIAVSGGTYEDWQEAVYSYKTVRKAETPMYMGGASSEIMFDEVIATTGQDNTPNGKQSLGELGGRGREVKEFNKGGHVKFEIEEPSIIMILVSLTPRITYSQGNKWFLTELDTLDDLHKPALDGIGYQDLIVEQMAWTGTKVDEDGNVIEKLSAGKVPAWMNYMTDVDECYGDFASEEGKAFMVLNRNYNIIENGLLIAPDDITTYIDPKKFNYAFAYNELEAQNFWAEIQFDITARRLMSAKQIPNL